LGNAFGFLDIFIFPLPFQWTLDIFPPVVRYRPEYIFAAEGRGAARQKRCPLTFQWTFFLRNLSRRGKYIFAAEARGTTAA
jgi:hypothetical protein